jgi:type I restriction-modification system DNA methylase subunit
MEECNLHTIVRLPNSVFRPYASIGTNLLFFEKGEPTKGGKVKAFWYSPCWDGAPESVPEEEWANMVVVVGTAS